MLVMVPARGRIHDSDRWLASTDAPGIFRQGEWNLTRVKDQTLLTDHNGDSSATEEVQETSNA